MTGLGGYTVGGMLFLALHGVDGQFDGLWMFFLRELLY